jgi:hypothetical protein
MIHIPSIYIFILPFAAFRCCHFLLWELEVTTFQAAYKDPCFSVDDLFIITNEFSMKFIPSGSVEECMYDTMNQVGPSVLLTTLTNAIAFLLGATSSMPAVSSFSIQAGLCIVCVFLLEMTAFCAILSLDARRVKVEYIPIIPKWNNRKFEE